MRWDDFGSWIQINGCSSRAAAAAPIAPRSLYAEYCAGHLPGRSTMDGLLFISVTMHSCTCSDSRAIATGRTSEDSVTRHRMIRRRHVCSVKTLAAGRVLSDANERARSLASMMTTLSTAETGARWALDAAPMWPAAAAALGPLGTPASTAGGPPEARQWPSSQPDFGRAD